MKELSFVFNGLNGWDQKMIEENIRYFAERKGIKLGEIARPLRIALTGFTSSFSIFELSFALGKKEMLARINDFVT